jgi:DNA-binding PadR family transcriptional regulator
MPILQLKTDTVYRHLKALKDLGLIEYTKDSAKDCIRITLRGHAYLIDNPIAKLPDETLPAKASRSKRFIKPTIQQLFEFKNENQLISDPKAFFDYQESKGWEVGRSKMKSWQAAFRNWERNHIKWDGGKKTRKNDSIKNGPSIEEKLTDRGWADEGFGSDAPVVDESVLEGNFIN